MNNNVLNFFKRNPEAPACHLVLDKCFHNASTAASYKRNMGARKVSVTTLQEFNNWKASQVPETISPRGEVAEKSTDPEDNQ